MFTNDQIKMSTCLSYVYVQKQIDIINTSDYTASL